MPSFFAMLQNAEMPDPQLMESHLRRLSQALDVMPWGIMSVDAREGVQRLVFCNERACALIRRLPADILGSSLEDILRDVGITEDIRIPAIDGERRAAHQDFHVRMDGRSCWLRIHIIPAKSPPTCTFLVIEDTTEAKIMEGQYFQAQRLEALGRLAGGVAHDFNNLLSIIDGYARVTKKIVGGNAQVLDYLDHIGKAVQRGASLTGHLLTFGQHNDAADSVIDLGLLVKDQELLLRPLLDASITLTIDARGETPVEASPDTVCQILLNLCINARDAMEGGGRMGIEIMRDDERGEAVLRVTDTGCGMSAEIQARIFDPFFTTKEQGKGTGLGLSMVHRLVTDMRGDIAVESAPGQGACFVIRLPLATRAALPPSDDVALMETAGRELEGLTALVAEDEPDLLALLSGVMEEMGAKVLRAADGAQALLLQEKYSGRIDFLLTDVVMPDMSGVKLAEIFCACRPQSHILFMSGYPADGQMARVRLPEGSVLMPKPLDFDKLSTAVQTALRGDNDNAAMRAGGVAAQEGGT